MDFGIAETGIARGSPPGITTEVLRVGFPPEEIRVVSPYIVHSVLFNGAVTIMDVKGDQFMVNGQRLKVYYEPDVVPLNHVDVFTMEEEPERPA
jgi:hypothetical protein